MKRSSRLLMAGLLSISASQAAQYYVATNGNDSAAGTIAAPWRTIQKAADSLAPGDTALVRSGVYSEAVTFHVSGSATGGYVTFANYPCEIPILDGTGLKVPAGDYAAGLFEITNGGYIAIQGFEIRNYRTNSTSYVPAGIDVTGAPHDIMLISNRLHDIANLNTTSGANAYGIAVHGTKPQAISNLVFRSNEIYNNTLGQSETMSLDGNVNGFDISGNFVHDNNNIGIGFIGYEGVCSDPAQDYARNGVCRSNIVWNISDAANPSYPANDYSADGIYCDGASNVVIELNFVHHCDLGVEMASEHAGHAANNCICRDNVIWSNYTTGISIGGYSTGVGSTTNCAIIHNTLYHNDTRLSGTGELLLQYAPSSNTFTHNILVANSQNLLIGNPFKQNSGNLLDWNLYFAPAGVNSSVWQWKNTSYTGFAAYKTASTNDSHSLFADPQFINAAQTNFHLSIGSPAVNAGDPNFQPGAGERDIDLQPRVSGGRTDIGADELNVLKPLLSVVPLSPGQWLLQLAGEPGHPYVWQQSSNLPNWLQILTNYADGSGFAQMTNATPPPDFFRAQTLQ